MRFDSSLYAHIRCVRPGLALCSVVGVGVTVPYRIHVSFPPIAHDASSGVLQGGGLYVNGGYTIMTLTLIYGNSAPTGASMNPFGGVLYYSLPAVAGHWLPNSDCIVNRAACLDGDASCVADRTTCALTSGSASDTPVAWTPPSPLSCREPLNIQPCGAHATNRPYSPKRTQPTHRSASPSCTRRP